VAGDDWIGSIPLAAGENIIAIAALDPSGNRTANGLTVYFAASGTDVTAPTVSISSHDTSVTFATNLSSVDLAGTASDNVEVVTVIWSNAATGESGSTDELSPWAALVTLKAGLNVITMKAYDTSGNYGTDRLVVNYQPPPPPPEYAPAGHCGSVGVDLLWPLGLLWLARRAARHRKRSP